MNLPTSKSFPGIGSKPTGRDHRLGELAALFATGVGVAAIHQGFDLKLGLPGHFGLIFMAATVVARLSAASSWAATVAACGYGAGTLGFTGLAPHAWSHLPIYGAVAVVIDVILRTAPGLLRRPLGAGLAGGLAFALKPLLLLLLVTFLGFEAGSLKHGLGFPLLTHFCFGGTGAVIGVLLWRCAQPREIEPR